MKKNIILPDPPASVNANQMSEEEVAKALDKGYKEYKAGLCMDAERFFSEFMKNKNITPTA